MYSAKVLLVVLLKTVDTSLQHRCNMESDKKDLIKNEIDYLKAALQISKIHYNGDEPPIGLLKRAHKLGCLAGVSKEELENL